MRVRRLAAFECFSPNSPDSGCGRLGSAPRDTRESRPFLAPPRRGTPRLAARRHLPPGVLSRSEVLYADQKTLVPQLDTTASTDAPEPERRHSCLEPRRRQREGNRVGTQGRLPSPPVVRTSSRLRCVVCSPDAPERRVRHLLESAEVIRDLLPPCPANAYS